MSYFQSACIPLFMRNKDVAAEAVSLSVYVMFIKMWRLSVSTSSIYHNNVFICLQVTGSGKTLAFVIPVLEILLKREEKLRKMQVSVKMQMNFTDHGCVFDQDI